MDKESSKKVQFENLYHEMSDSIFRFCLIRVSNREVALDLTQDAFMKFWDYFVKSEHIEYKKAFLFKIVRNLIIDYYRKRKPTYFEEEEIEIENDIRFSENLVEVNAQAKEIIEKINQLDPIYREAVYMRLVEELGPKEIALITGESENNVSVRINRGIKKIKEQYE